MDDVKLKVVDGWAVLPSSLRRPDGITPRFRIEFPAHAPDRGAIHLVINEFKGGYELATRNLLERLLRAGDLLIDVGAHWGFFTLQAVTHPAGNVRVAAFEPDPANAGILFRNLVINDVTPRVQLVCAACGGESIELAPLVSSSSMEHSVHGVSLTQPSERGPAKWVAVVSLDAALSFLPPADPSPGRVILKIDAEGYEPQILAGAKGLLDSGRVAAIIWENGHADSAAMRAMVGDLTARGFSHQRPPGENIDGPLLPFNPDEPYVGNVFSLRPDA